MAGELTLLLQAASEGDEPALNRLVALLYVDLRRLARKVQDQRGQTLDTTSLVHECYLRFIQSGRLELNDRAHFFCLAARVMRQLLCDYARERLAKKRGAGAVHVELCESDAAEQAEATHCLAVNQALDTLAEIRPVQARVVECRFFAGLTEEETAEALNRSLRSVQRDWSMARNWLSDKLDS
ncbi:MAG: sigma-70 family RNA polymerase sigma factor [Wenzhouxiangella sp.]|nr:MAG: sigma-70 family RNA polymerase sigma factor [Wenzhouxiangella sp.]